MTETCKSCRLFFLYPSPEYDMGICEETRFIMAPEAPACNYYLPWKWTQKETTNATKEQREQLDLMRAKAQMNIKPMEDINET